MQQSFSPESAARRCIRSLARQPRAMLPLAGKPLVRYQLELLKRHGIREAVLWVYAEAASAERTDELVAAGAAWVEAS